MEVEKEIKEEIQDVISETEVEEQPAGSQRKKRRGKPRKRPGVTERQAAKARLLRQTSAEGHPSADEGSLKRSPA